jgi:LysM repeat protein
MTFWAGPLRSVALLLACLFLSGCFPSGSGPLDEEKEPQFLAGKNRVSTLDYPGAVECFEKALQVNPHSASAHFELACLFDRKEVDPAAAIYHYEHYLKLCPNPGNADVVKQRVMACKQALAEGVSLGPVTDRLQRQFEQVAEENKSLSEQKTRLTAELEQWRSYAARLESLTNRSAAQATAPARPTQVIPTVQTSAVFLAQAAPAASASAASGRTYTVKAGETLVLIAKKCGIKLETLMAANPHLEPRRLKVGQSLRIPAS